MSTPSASLSDAGTDSSTPQGGDTSVSIDPTAFAREEKSEHGHSDAKRQGNSTCVADVANHAAPHEQPPTGSKRQPTATEAAQMFVFTASKAGMKDVDKDHVQKVVFEMSKDSRFFQNSIRQNEKVDARINDMRAKLKALTQARRETLRRQVDALVAKMETSRELTRTKVVVDMDMFYAAVEMRDKPSLRDRPLAVGGIGMLSTTNYVARKFGVRAAMPGFIGKELCPALVIVPPNFDKYTAISAQIREIVSHYDPQYRAMSLDEVYLDITDYMETHWAAYARTGSAPLGFHSNSDASDQDECDDIMDSFHVNDFVGSSDGDECAGEQLQLSDTKNRRKRRRECSGIPSNQREAVAAAIVNEIREKIFQTTQLTASAGIAANTMLAKVCSDVNKPNGQYVLPFTRDDVMSFVEKLSVRKIGGIGKVMEKTLGSALEITTGKHLYDRRIELFHLFSERTASWLLRISLGLQEPVSESDHGGRKSYSRERTFSAQGISDSRSLEKICRELCDMLATDMQEGSSGAKTLTLKLKCVDFSVRSRAVTTTRTLRSSDDLFANAMELLRKELPLNLRLMGVRASALVSLDGMALRDGSTCTRKRQAIMDSFTTARTGYESVELDPFEDDMHFHADEQQDEGESHSERDGTRGECGTVIGRPRHTEQKLEPPPIAAFDKPLGTADPVKELLDVYERDRQRVHRPSSFASVMRADQPPVPQSDSFQPCPVCGKTINAGNSIAIAVHVDACLRRAQNRQGSIHQFFRR